MASPFHVSICGGGIGGLMLAVVIGKYSTLPVDMFEAGPTMSTIGAGVTFYGRTMDIMREMGLYDEFVNMAIAPPKDNTGPRFRKADQPDGYHWFTRNLKRGVSPVHRKDLMDFFLRNIPASCKIHTSKKLTFYDVDSETGKIKLHFCDGTSILTDVLVGADGIHSATRQTMYQNFASSAPDDASRKKLLECIEPVWTGILAYRNLIPVSKLQKEHPQAEPPTDLTLNVGKNKYMVTYPVSQGRLVNVGIFLFNCAPFGTPFEGRWVTEVSEQEVLDQFEDWEIHCKAIAKCFEKPSRWALHSIPPLPHYVDGKVALLGDAAHAMEPHLGAGAGQAMEDAYVLGRLLTHTLTHAGNVGDALKIYEEIRLPIANGVAQRSHKAGRHCTFNAGVDGAVPTRGSAEELDRLRIAIEDAWGLQSETEWMWGVAEERWRTECGALIML